MTTSAFVVQCFISLMIVVEIEVTDDPEAGSQKRRSPVTAAAFTPDGQHVVIGSQRGLEQWNWPGLGKSMTIPTDLEHVHDLCFSPDGKRLLVAGGTPGETGIVEVLDWPDRKRVLQFAEHRDLVYRVAWSPDGKSWATASADGTCLVVDRETNVKRARFEGHSRAVVTLCWLNGDSLVSAGVDQSLKVWNHSSSQLSRTLDNHIAPVTGAAIRPGGDASRPVLATISEDRTVRLWQPTIGRLMRFVRLPSIPGAISWTPDGKHMVVGCHDGQLRLIDPDTVEVIRTEPGLKGRIFEIRIDPVSGSILIAGDSGIRAREPLHKVE